MREVYEAAEKEGKRVLTAAEYMNRKPAVLLYTKTSTRKTSRKRKRKR